MHFFIIFKFLSLKQIKKLFWEGESLKKSNFCFCGKLIIYVKGVCVCVGGCGCVGVGSGARGGGVRVHLTVKPKFV